MSKRAILTSLAAAVILLLAFLRFQGVSATLRVVRESQTCDHPGCFEAIAHYDYLYDGIKKVARVGDWSISPSGAYAAFENEDGRIMLYQLGSGKLKDVTQGQTAIPETFNWNEAQARLVITYYQEHPNPIYAHCPPSTIRLD